MTLQGVRVCGSPSGATTQGQPARDPPAAGPRWTERTLTVRSSDTNVSRVAIHLQLESGGGAGEMAFTTEVAVDMAERVLELNRQQRSLAHPVLVRKLTFTDHFYLRGKRHISPC